jgi:molybdopterin-guanine dinucleotide biosynthesis protein A
MASRIRAEDITGLILCGGKGSRMGGVDKGLQTLKGQPLVQHTMLRLQPQVGAMLINANRHLDEYARFGLPVLPDSQPDFAGPLAGFMAGFIACKTEWMLTVPCDSPLFPLDLAERLAGAASQAQADVAAPLTLEDGQARLQPVFCLLRSSLRASLAKYMQEGGRKIDHWLLQHQHVFVPFHAPSDSKAFFNANTLAELNALEPE